ncbi:hypothetical protein BB987_12465 [Photorhabdus temperata]|uniref:Transposase n=1 Tax=Photorhabdus khanii NC19 TaxID=1004151 RepID=W3VCA7_9GAMM|nr:hypothetical protein [Photorhabdus khanii]ETS33438.1 hypothetical protein PTE_00600 [Photorhabdus khanii NC19]OHV53388.1 hypothetical protein BB987_12465 [Photorhabdus temperata]
MMIRSSQQKYPSAGNLPKRYAYLLETLSMFELPAKLPDRKYPRVMRRKPQKYPVKREASQLN